MSAFGAKRTFKRHACLRNYRRHFIWQHAFVLIPATLGKINCLSRNLIFRQLVGATVPRASLLMIETDSSIAKDANDARRMVQLSFIALVLVSMGIGLLLVS